LAVKWKDVHDVFFLTTAHEDLLVEAPSSTGAHCKIKPAAVLDYKYKTGVDRSDQMLSCYSFASKVNKMVEDTFLSSVRPSNGECTHLAKKIKQEKNVTGNVLRKSRQRTDR
jgi:hypothetical protein